MKRILSVIFGVLAVAVLAGCDDKNTDVFVGHWVEVVKVEGRKPAQMDIAFVDGAYQINEIIRVAGESIKNFEVGRPEGNTLINVKGGMRNIQLDGSNIIYRNKTFVKQSAESEQKG